MEMDLTEGVQLPPFTLHPIFIIVIEASSFQFVSLRSALKYQALSVDLSKLRSRLSR
jgi:hypothetical protein